MSKKGYYRYKLEGLQKGITKVTFHVNQLPFVTYKVIVRETCSGSCKVHWVAIRNQII